MTRTKYIVACIAVVAAASTALGFCWPFGPRERTLQLHGTVETQEVRLSSRVGGRVKKVAVAEGTLVQPGQVLVVFDYPELEARRDQLAANLEAAEAARDKAYNGARPEELRAPPQPLAVLAARRRLEDR